MIAHCLLWCLLATVAFTQAGDKVVLRGVVKDITGEVFPGASVRIEAASLAKRTAEGSPLILKTDTQGRFTAELLKGDYRVCASGAGFATKCEVVAIVVQEPKELLFSLAVARTDDPLIIESGVDDLVTVGAVPISDLRILAYVPDELFHAYIKREVTAQLCKDVKNCRIEYEMLQDGAAQAGDSSSYYLWVKIFTVEKLTTEGAARVAAVKGTDFEVTQFLSTQQIRKSPNVANGTFPPAVAGEVIRRAGHRQRGK